MGALKLYKVLGCKFNATPKAWASKYKRDFFGLGSYPAGWNPQLVREEDILSCCGMLALQHLGFEIPGEAVNWLNQGFDVVVDYFCGDWWKGNADAARSMDKSRRTRERRWFNAFARGFLLGLLSERWHDLANVCAWVEPGYRPEPLLLDSEEVEPELASLYIVISSTFRRGAISGLGGLIKRLEGCNRPRVRYLFEAWKAAESGSQRAFDEAFLKSVAHFSAVSGSGPTPLHWVALHQTVVGLAAVRLGLTIPKMSPALDSVILTRESLGLEVLRPSAKTSVADQTAKPKSSRKKNAPE